VGGLSLEVLALHDVCRKGGANASVPPEEQLDEWVSLVASATSRPEVEEVVQPVLAM
jgi:hypothetical protein